MNVYVTGTGSHVPEVVVTNDALVQFPASARPSIAAKTGILERRHAPPGVATSDLAVIAAQRCLEVASCPAGDVGGIIVATSTPDHPLPSTAASVQHRLGATSAWAFDLNAVCSGGVYALAVAFAQVTAFRRPVLVIGADTYSRILNPKDFSTYPYFGDGAGAVLLTPDRRPSTWAKVEGGDFILGCDGGGDAVIQVPAGGSREPAATCTDPTRLFFKMAGRQVYQFAIDKGSSMIRELTVRAGGPGAVHAAVLHQANVNILREIATLCSLPVERMPINLDRYGNTAAAGCLIALDGCARNGAIPLGKSVLMAVFGGGLAWAGARLSAVAE